MVSPSWLQTCRKWRMSLKEKAADDAQQSDSVVERGRTEFLTHRLPQPPEVFGAEVSNNCPLAQPTDDPFTGLVVVVPGPEVVSPTPNLLGPLTGGMGVKGGNRSAVLVACQARIRVVDLMV